MTIKTEKYTDAIARLPIAGQHIIGHQDDNHIVVYQAYNHQIADYAVAHQALGGPAYSYDRMSWIKPNFLWMMYRCGWATKPNQERVLAFWISKQDFEAILNEAVYSSYSGDVYSSYEEWKEELNRKEVRLQWDPDHDPHGNKLARRAIQLSMKGQVLKNFGQHYIRKVKDVTGFVQQQKLHVDNQQLDRLLVPYETVFPSPLSIVLPNN